MNSLNSLFVKTGKIGGFGRSLGTSSVWDFEQIQLILFSAKGIVPINFSFGNQHLKLDDILSSARAAFAPESTPMGTSIQIQY